MKEGIELNNNYEAYRGEKDSFAEKLSNVTLTGKKKIEVNSELDFNSIIILMSQITDRIECLDKLICQIDTRIVNLNSRLDKIDNKFQDSYEKLQDKFEEKIERVSLDIKEANNKFNDVDTKMNEKFDKAKNDKRDRISLLISAITLLLLLITTFLSF